MAAPQLRDCLKGKASFELRFGGGHAILGIHADSSGAIRSSVDLHFPCCPVRLTGPQGIYLTSIGLVSFSFVATFLGMVTLRIPSW